MAVTNIVPIHKGTTSIQKFIKKKIDYITDRNKTELPKKHRSNTKK